MLRLTRSLVVLTCFAASISAVAQEEGENPFLPGLVANYSSGSSTVKRTDEVIAFDWQAAAPDARLPPGNFTASWRGRLMTTPPGAYRLHCFAQGRVEIKLAGKTVVAGRAENPQWLVSETLELPFDRHLLEIHFEKIAPKAQLLLCWSGPGFSLEPIPERFLMHDRAESLPSTFERGKQLAVALRCGACHQDSSMATVPAPALDRLTGNIQEGWLVDWLSNHQALVAGGAASERIVRRMPELGLNREEATAIAAWLLREPAIKVETQKNQQKETKGTKEGEKKNGKKGKNTEEKPKPSAEEGERIVLSRGCLACHQLGELGESGVFGGGDLTALFNKRPVDFLVRWLENPEAINRSHRMPAFAFTSDETQSLKLWAEARSRLVSPTGPPIAEANRPALVRDGSKLVEAFRCANCHLVSREKNDLASAFRPPLTAMTDWTKSCAGEEDRQKGRPGYRLVPADKEALQAYYSQSRPGEGQLSPQARGRELLVQHNCLACHQREGIDRSASLLPARLQDKLTAVAEAHSELAPLVPSMTPPALNSVGDKLRDAALVEAISRKGKPHRPYLLAQMPRFELKAEQLADLTAYFTATDRIPDGGAGLRPAVAENTSRAGQRPAPQEALAAAGPRLVTADGLACTSCHQVGSVLPSKAPLNARGPDISMLDKRIRREWYDRWCANPARIVPRMEMPSVQVAVRGVLNENVHDQLAAVWHILNTPGFEPPEPNPVRVLRLSGVLEKNERAIAIHDVVKDGDKTYLFPLVIGVPNRHNLLFDLETNRLAAWWLGDTARQRTKGKSWYWEIGAKSILEPSVEQSEISLVIDGKEYAAESLPQWPTAALSGFDGWSFNYQLRFRLPGSLTTPSILGLRQWFQPRLADQQRGLGAGFERGIAIGGELPPKSRIRFRIAGSDQSPNSFDLKNRAVKLKGIGDPIAVFADLSKAQVNSDNSVDFTLPERTLPGVAPGPLRFQIRYATKLSADRYEIANIPQRKVEPTALDVAPGFSAIRLPLDDGMMPSALAWDLSGRLYFATLKGQVFQAVDSDGDGNEESESLLIDGLPTPYGLAVNNPLTIRGKRSHFIDVLVKTGLVRLRGDGPHFENRLEIVGKNAFITAPGWGATDDYHDWAVGLVPGEDGNFGENGEYFVALPCQQDQRSEVAAKYRGSLLKLVPRGAPLDVHHQYDVEVISSGHRFPMGIARNRDGELFVTDNQGNYNPFNELNHVQKGAHFGFINALEKEKGFVPPPLTPPAINIPHPWTRSVNGICFLDTPEELRRVGSAHQASKATEKVGTAHPTSIYGAMEGHLVGCEYDTRRLIRMSLQKIGDTFQGCAYPLSIPTEEVEKGLLGPIVCAIKPTTGELYVGEIRDSGWGASNNIGQIVKIKIEPEKLPCGIAEVRANATGFTIDFFQPVERAKAADVASYSIASYRRESTPAYGGSDIDRRDEKVSRAEVSEDGKRVTLALPELRTGHVYELHLKNLAPGGGVFHPDEAHYTLHQIPQ